MMDKKCIECVWSDGEIFGSDVWCKKLNMYVYAYSLMCSHGEDSDAW